MIVFFLLDNMPFMLMHEKKGVGFGFF